ncbi:hypothetical protein bplSymb_SCF00801P002 [Bathymodiolus platifrons methanotrophic gill symbiont]|uniref:hypothetical protein n=1 Tax=Bathymodiolus platifrons methanotrophic gill symbiont TaxID=113268 RepID=UPI000B62C3C0|nr:hypothetical protein [Bathymodiolus platifrons methanotrophic gill symbiont]GAW85491.1 hypothetical protein bplSymb_SCF00801P002 [Bathymodiolus platifrons methanotrophic gill symbiont]
MNKVKFLSSFVRRTDGVKVPVPIDIDSPNKNDDEYYQVLLTSINSLLDFDNLIVLAGSGTSLTFTNIAPSMGLLWEKCKKKILNSSMLFLMLFSMIKTKLKEMTQLKSLGMISSYYFLCVISI